MKRWGLPELINISWALLWFMLPLSQRGTVFTLWLLGIVLLAGALVKKPVITKGQVIISALLFSFFLLHALTLLWDPETEATLRVLERKVPLLVVPLILLYGNSLIKNPGKGARIGLYSGLALSGIIMVAGAISRSLDGFEFSTWMYHEFTQTFEPGAIYFSWYLSLALIALVSERENEQFEKFRPFLAAFFLILLFLAASKIFILLTVPYLFFMLIKKLKNSKKRWAIGIFLGVVIIGSLPFLKRVGELQNTELSVAFRQDYNWDTPLNGITLRILQWRLGLEILNDNNAWLSGTGIGSRQEILDNYYRKYNVYSGNPQLGDHGYLGYNFHNQFMETLVGTGVAGLVILLLLFSSVFLYIRNQLLVPTFAFVVTFGFFITESVLERQAGIIMFCLLLCTFGHGCFLKMRKDGGNV